MRRRRLTDDDDGGSNEPLRILALLRREGWCKNTFTDERGGMCLLGAHMELSCRDRLTRAEDARITARWVALVMNLLSEDGHVHPSVPGFNDDPDTTFADVEKMLLRAAERWDVEV